MKVTITIDPKLELPKLPALSKKDRSILAFNRSDLFWSASRSNKNFTALLYSLLWKALLFRERLKLKFGFRKSEEFLQIPMRDSRQHLTTSKYKKMITAFNEKQKGNLILYEGGIGQ